MSILYVKLAKLPRALVKTGISKRIGADTIVHCILLQESQIAKFSLYYHLLTSSRAT